MKYFLSVLVITLLACNSEYTPRKKGYYKIDFPERAYRSYHPQNAPYSFDYPVYAEVVKDTTFFEESPENPWWANIDFPLFNGRIYLSYKQIQNEKHFEQLVNDAFKMTYSHTTKASAINDSLMTTPNGLTGVYFKVGGNAATAHQFFVTDSVKHFLRGALYFDSTPNEDSLSVVNDFLFEDMRELINSLKWY